MDPQRTTANPNELVLSPRHRRTVWGDMPGLIASVKELGVIEPIVVRQSDPPQILAGARRHRAAIAAGLAEVPIVFVACGDEQAVLIQYHENAHRESLHPLDEADLFADLLDYGYEIKGIAKRCRVPKSHVLARLQLRKLAPAVRSAFAEGDVTEEIAQTIAGLPLEDQQVAVLDAFRAGAITDADEAASWVRRHLVAPLDGVPWELTDDTMPGGACSRCPKRSGTQRELFKAIAGKEADLCLDVACRSRKMDVAWDRVVADAKGRNDREVLADLDEITVDDLFVPRAAGGYGVVRSSGYVDALEECPRVPGKIWHDAAREAGAKPIVYLARDQEGKPRLLLKEPEVARAVRRAVETDGTPAAAQEAAIDPERAAQRQRAAQRRETTARLVSRLIELPDDRVDDLLGHALALLESVASASSSKVVAGALGLDPGTAIATRAPTPATRKRLIAALLAAELGATRPPVAGLAELAELVGVELL